MHENRETSETPVAQPGSRSAGEGNSHTARMHVAEESHRGIVPMNHSNNDETPLAESEEGRLLIKENAGQSSTHLTQSRVGVSQGLAGVRKAAKENKGKFTALLHHMTTDLLRESFYSLKRKAAPGVDGVTWEEYETGLEDRLADLHGRVHRGAYRATPSRRVYIEKEDGRQRPLGVAAVEDSDHSLLDDFVLHSRDSQWTLPSILFLDVHSARWCRPIGSPMYPAMQISEPIFQSGFILLPGDSVHSWCRFSLQRVKAFPQ